MYNVCSYEVNLSKIVALKTVNRFSLSVNKLDLDVVPISKNLLISLIQLMITLTLTLCLATTVFISVIFGETACAF